eukprot:jgi/Tetstr1/425494/TSEL_015940.t1
MIDFACVSSTTPTWSNDPRWCTPGIAATEAEHGLARGMLEYAVNDLDPSLFFELVEHVAVAVVEHELFSSPSSGKKKRRLTGESGGSRML